MANIEDCPGFETFGADVKAARQAKRVSRKAMAEKINIDWRYLANIENDGAIPSLPVVIQLIKACGLPVERYFKVKSTPYFLAHGLNAPMLASVISMLERSAPCFLSCFRLCWPWCSVFLPLARCCRYFFSAACST